MSEVRSTRSVAIVVILAGTALAFVGVLLHAYELSAITSVCSVTLSAVALYLSRRPVAAAVPQVQQREYAVQRLAELVGVQWEEEAKVRGLADPEPMPVAWTLTSHDVADRPQYVFTGEPGFDERSDRIAGLAERFLALSRRRIVILGGPGSGKTTLAVQLLLRLLEIRTPADPVPVLLTANSWDTDAFPRMQDWLAFRLGKDYSALRAIDPAIPRALVDNHLVLPVIDGLDELAAAQRAALLTALNESLGATDPLVLTCRTDEFLDTVDRADVLTAAAVIEARPLTPSTAASYLDNCLAPRIRAEWEWILATLRHDDHTPLSAVCATPLGLWLLRTVYLENRRDPTPLLDPVGYPDAAAITAHLFEELIPATITKRHPLRDGTDHLRPCRAWEPAATRQWLMYLAVCLHNERDVRWWHLAAALPTGAMAALLIPAGGLTGGLILGAGRIDRTGLVGGLVFGLLLGLVVERKIRRAPEPGYANVRLRGRGQVLASNLADGVMFGSVFGLACGLGAVLLTQLIGERMTEPAGQVVAGLTMVGSGWLLFALTRRIKAPGNNLRSSTGRRSRGPAIAGVLLYGLIVGLAAGLMAMLPSYWAVIALWSGEGASLQLIRAIGWALGLIVVLLGGLPFGYATWMRSPDSSIDRSSPDRGSSKLPILAVLLLGLAVGIVSGMALGPPSTYLAPWLDHFSPSGDQLAPWYQHLDANIVGFMTELTAGLGHGVMFGLLVGVAGGLVNWIRSPGNADLWHTPSSAYPRLTQPHHSDRVLCRIGVCLRRRPTSRHDFGAWGL
ncbi:NACHT domain-containing protein [Nocardia pseudovaccinii]|uniref:NACHT domain-containing protein n=1 Tax=Nocardia pseudovaccinii TaxID=189540 RepID=UPI003D949F42